MSPVTMKVFPKVPLTPMHVTVLQRFPHACASDAGPGGKVKGTAAWVGWGSLSGE